jgi:hypothetical protein
MKQKARKKPQTRRIKGQILRFYGKNSYLIFNYNPIFAECLCRIESSIDENLRFLYILFNIFIITEDQYEGKTFGGPGNGQIGKE